MHTVATYSQLHSQNNGSLQSTRQMNPSIILLSARHELLYLTPTARQILGRLDRAESNLPSVDRLPPIIQGLCDTIEIARRRCSSPTEWAAVQIHRMILTTHHRIEVGGFIIPEWSTPPSHRLLIVLEMLLAEAPRAAEDTVPPPQLTARQESVAHGLMRGLTNKEMAVELRLSAHTIKEYVRAIMIKVKATTRAGVVARLAGAAHPINQSQEPTRSECDSNVLT